MSYSSSSSSSNSKTGKIVKYFVPPIPIPHARDCPCDTCQLSMVDSQGGVSELAPSVVRIPRKLLLRTGKSGSKFSGLKPTKVKLWSTQLNAQSAATSTLSINQALVFNASTFPELSNWNVVYDEVRVLGVHLHFMPIVQNADATNTNSAANAFVAGYAIEFDPSISGPSSINQVLESQHAVGPFYVSGANNNVALSPSVMRFHKLTAKMPGPLAPIVASDCVGSAWFTVDVTAPNICVLNGWHSGLGTGGVSLLFYIWELLVEFRMRT